MWAAMLTVDLLVPLAMMGFGQMFLKCDPGEINSGFGYRTKRSMKSKDAWEFAHRCCGRIWRAWGLALLILTILVMLLSRGQAEDVLSTIGAIVCIFQTVVLVGTIIPVERALRKHFDEDGRRR